MTNAGQTCDKSMLVTSLPHSPKAPPIVLVPHRDSPQINFRPTWDPFAILPESEVNDEDLYRYPNFRGAKFSKPRTEKAVGVFYCCAECSAQVVANAG